MSRQKGILAGSAGLYALALALIATWRTPIDRPFDGTLATILTRLHDLGVPMWFDYRLIETWANVVLFIPFGILATIYAGGNAFAAIALGCGLSTLIEAFQSVASPERYATVTDIIANTAGATIGAVAVIALARVFRDRHNRVHA